jgi:hypothetical protein
LQRIRNFTYATFSLFNHTYNYFFTGAVAEAAEAAEAAASVFIIGLCCLLPLAMPLAASRGATTALAAALADALAAGIAAGIAALAEVALLAAAASTLAAGAAAGAWAGVCANAVPIVIEATATVIIIFFMEIFISIPIVKSECLCAVGDHYVCP